MTPSEGRGEGRKGRRRKGHDRNVTDDIPQAKQVTLGEKQDQRQQGSE